MSNLYKCPICGVPTNYSSINHQPQPCLKCSPGNVIHIPGNVFVADCKPPKKSDEAFMSDNSSRLMVPVEQVVAAIEEYDPRSVKMSMADYVVSKCCGEATTQATLEDHPRDIKEAYWHEQYQLMREKFWKQIDENSKLAERIRELEEQLKAKQGESRELYAMLGHIVDWSPELPYYMKDEYKTLFRNALAAARELLSKFNVKEGKMSNEQINIAIAEACGWTDTDIVNCGGKLMYGQTEVPNYCGDLNAMREAEIGMTEPMRQTYEQELQRVLLRTYEENSWLVSATARQRAEAFLRTIEKWEEGK